VEISAWNDSATEFAGNVGGLLLVKNARVVCDIY
jgi:hypothetical protein